MTRARRPHRSPLVRRAAVLTERWSVDNGLLTATLKPKRGVILERYKDRVADLYRGHGG